MLMVLGYWWPTRIVIAVSDGWFAVVAIIITLAILLGAWKLMRNRVTMNEPERAPRVPGDPDRVS